MVEGMGLLVMRSTKPDHIETMFGSIAAMVVGCAATTQRGQPAHTAVSGAAAQWRPTSSIDTITFLCAANFKQNSVFTPWGLP